MTAPVRIQRSRAKGWRMPEGAVYVGRPSRWGNPFPIDGEWITGAAQAFGYPAGPAFLRGTAVALYRWWLTGELPIIGLEPNYGWSVEATEGSNGGAVWLRRTSDKGGGVIDVPLRPDLAPLRGRDLACWCPVGGWSGDVYATGALLLPCHADVLLELANA